MPKLSTINEKFLNFYKIYKNLLNRCPAAFGGGTNIIVLAAFGGRANIVVPARLRRAGQKKVDFFII